MSWGYRIIILYVAFVAMISFLIYLCVGQRIDLVSADYYEQEIKYQDQVVRMQNVIEDKKQVPVSYDQEMKSVGIQFPHGSLSGKINFFKPDNADEDFTTAISTNEEGYQAIAVDKFKPGKWYVKLSWKEDAKEYFQQEALYIK